MIYGRIDDVCLRESLIITIAWLGKYRLKYRYCLEAPFWRPKSASETGKIVDLATLSLIFNKLIWSDKNKSRIALAIRRDTCGR
jgi:hypothetical protein